MVGWGVCSSGRSSFSVYYFNTVRRAVYYVLYVLIFIIFNTVFFIIYPWPHPVRAARISPYGAACVHRNQAQHAPNPARPAGCASSSSRCAVRLEPADSALLRVRASVTGARAPQDLARRVIFVRRRLAHGGASPDENAHDTIFAFFVRYLPVERLCFRCRVVGTASQRVSLLRSCLSRVRDL